jgi:hypothetical protein
MFGGWDWASTTHVTVVDDAGAVVDHRTPPHTEAGLADTLTRLARHGQPDQLPVAIEQSSGLVVDRLLAAGHPVVPVHASAFHAAPAPLERRWRQVRPWRQLQAGRLPAHRRPPAAPTRSPGRCHPRAPSPGTAARGPRQGQDRRQQPLGALLDAHWPGAKQIFSRLGSEIALAFLEVYPTPQAAARLGEARMAAFCRRHSYRGGRSPAELLARLRAAPTPSLAWHQRR